MFERLRAVGQSPLEKPTCIIYLIHMFNLLSFLFGIISLVIVFPALIPFLGWANWLALPLIAIGVVLGQISSSKSGRNFCLIVLLIATVRLIAGGGFF